MQVKILTSIGEITRESWNALTDGTDPFLRHEFLFALEETGCVSQQTGWAPRHVAIFEDSVLAAACPLYLKSHSYGEYVFDWAWAKAYAQAGIPYYPKLTGAVPFTPVGGARLLVRADRLREPYARALIAAARELAHRLETPSLHFLFFPETDVPLFSEHGFLARTGYQFHWRNEGFADFHDFLESFSSAKRYNVKRERRQVREAGIETQLLAGTEIQENHWETFYEFYRSTADRHGAIAYLNLAFFKRVHELLPHVPVMVLAKKNGETVGGAINFLGGNTLYGRYWGARENHPGLHFEVCYYRAIEYCLKHGLKRFEAGAQGEHKLARGFLPTATHSAHWLKHPAFVRAVADYLNREQRGIEMEMHEFTKHSPYKETTG